jgi:Glycosyl transferases group 1
LDNKASHPLRPLLRRVKIAIAGTIYAAITVAVVPLLALAAPFLRLLPRRGYVLHVGGPSHVLEHSVATLRQQGIDASYLALGSNIYSRNADFRHLVAKNPLVTVYREIVLFLSVVGRFTIVHSHAMVMPSWSLWEIPLLRLAGVRFVAHYRGCEARNRARNMALHPHVDICQDCDSHAYACSNWRARLRRFMRIFADAVLVTTPDMRDFVPTAEQMPFFSHPEFAAAPQRPGAPGSREFVIVHSTGHPGIEGTVAIERAIERLRQRGYRIRWVFLTRVPNEEVVAALREADVAIAKMKMGYYANLTIEAMSMGIPCITYVQDRFVNDELTESGLILTDIDHLEETIAGLIDDPDRLARKRALARSSILRLHDNAMVASRYQAVYDRILV